MGAKVLTMSDSKGFIHDPAGIDRTKLDWIMDLKNNRRGRIQEYVAPIPWSHFPRRPTALGHCLSRRFPCATQNELNEEEAHALVNNGCIVIAEGANMPSTPEAIEVFDQAKVLFAPGKASNAVEWRQAVWKCLKTA